MESRNQVAALVILVLGAAAGSFADTPPNSQPPADVPATPAAPASPADSEPEKKRKAAAIATREAVKARIARCRLHPETCRQ